jgi:hypothetical protein
MNYEPPENRVCSGDIGMRFFANDNSKISVVADSIVNRSPPNTPPDRIYLVLDYCSLKAWVEEGNAGFYAPETEDGGGTFWLIDNDDAFLDLEEFFDGSRAMLARELSRPGSASRDIQNYCMRFKSSR